MLCYAALLARSHPFPALVCLLLLIPSPLSPLCVLMLTHPIPPAEAAALSAAGSVEVRKEDAVAEAEAATKKLKAEAKSAAAKAKAAAKEAAALEKAKAEYDKEVAHLTKLAAQKRDDTIEKAGEELKKAVTTASIIRRKEEASAQSARAKADEKAAKACLSAEKDAWKERQAAEKEAHAAFAKAAKLATSERKKAEKAAEAAREAAIKAILAERDRRRRGRRDDARGRVEIWSELREADARRAVKTEYAAALTRARLTAIRERAAEHDEAAANNLEAARARGGVAATLLEWIGSFIWGAKSLAPEVEGAK
ncbi:hypothetical protein B0H13DRAFT_2662368 [Mycena leptocephala]|nr:hypothetical protein B0H13DRAFT_2662368 [Mycena leptocephala]